MPIPSRNPMAVAGPPQRDSLRKCLVSSFPLGFGATKIASAHCVSVEPPQPNWFGGTKTEERKRINKTNNRTTRNRRGSYLAIAPKRSALDFTSWISRTKGSISTSQEEAEKPRNPRRSETQNRLEKESEKTMVMRAAPSHYNEGPLPGGGGDVKRLRRGVRRET